MRSPLELLDLPYTFTQLPLIGAEKFARLACGRDVQLDRWRLEALHRLGLLVPLFLVKRPTADIRAALRRGDEHRAHVLGNWEPTTREQLLEAREAGLLFELRRKTVRSQQALKREIDGHKFETSVYLYAQHQLACLWPPRWLMPWISWHRRGDGLLAQLKLTPEQRAGWLRQTQSLREAIVAVLALEPVYTTPASSACCERRSASTPIPSCAGGSSSRRMAAGVARPRRRLGARARERDARPGAAARPNRRLERAPRLQLAPALGGTRGHAAARHGHASRRGNPAALLRPAGARKLAMPIPTPPRTRTPYDMRLKRRRPLDAVLTHFGLLPHPRLVLIVGGATERLLVPRVMRKLELRSDDDFISVQDAEGVRTNLGPLLAYLARSPAKSRTTDTCGRCGR